MDTLEVRDGRLIANGSTVPLNKGLILLALTKAGWNGSDGLLSPALSRRLFQADPRIGAFLRAG